MIQHEAHPKDKPKTNVSMHESIFRSAKEEILTTSAGRVKVVRIGSPDAKISKTPVVILPAYRLEPWDIRELITAAHESGREVLGLGYLEQGQRQKSEKNSFRRDHSEETYAKETNALFEVLNHSGIEQEVDIITASHGALIALLAALRSGSEAARVRNIVLINPAGFFPDDRVGELQKRMYDMFVEEGILTPEGRDKRLKDLDESDDSTLLDGRPMLGKLADHKITVIVSEDDTVTPPDITTNAFYDNNKLLIDKIVTVKGGHLSFLGEECAKQAVEELGNLNQTTPDN